MNNRWGISVVSLVTLGLALTACSAGGSAAAPRTSLTPPSIAAPATPTSWWSAQSGLPLMAYDVSDSDQKLLRQASLLLVVRCMNAHGFSDFTAASIPMIGSTGKRQGGAGAYGYIDQEVAATKGFHSAVSAPPPPVAHLSAAEQRQEGDCISTSMQQLGGAPGQGSGRLLTQLFDQATGATAVDSRVREAQSRWAACMKGRGFNVSDPVGLAASARAAGSDPSAGEISTALADVSCTRSSNLAGVYFAVQAGYQNQLIQLNGEALKSVLEQNRAQVAKASRVVSGVSGA